MPHRFVAVAAILVAMGATLGRALDATQTIAFLGEGASCYTSTSTNTFYFPSQAKCAACPANGYSIASTYIASSMSPVSGRVLDAVIARGRGSDAPLTCMCDTAKGYALSFPETWSVLNSSVLFSDVPGKVIGKPSGIAVGSSTFDVSCISCAGAGLVPSLELTATGNQGCVPCGGVDSVLSLEGVNISSLLLDELAAGLLLNSTNASESLLAASTYSSTTPGVCQCPNGFVVTETLGGRRLPVQLCVACPNGARDSRDPSVCRPCEFPMRVSSTGFGCVCASGYEALPSGGCEQSTRLSSIFSGIAAVTTLTPPNVNNGGSAGSAVQSAVVSQNLASAATACQSTQNSSACNLLANLCVLSQYDLTSTACSMYRKLQNAESCTSRVSCEKPQRLPWLYYIRDSPSIFDDADFVKTVNLNERLTLVLSRYSWDGHWLGSEPVVTQLQQCQLSSQDSLDFFAVGSQRKYSCHLNIPHFLAADPTDFFELYVQQDDNTLFPVPILMDYSSADLEPSAINDETIYRAAATSSGGVLQPVDGGYRRRFFLYDNIGGRSDTSGSGSLYGGSTTSSSTTFPAYLTIAKNMRLLVEIKPNHESQIYVPLMIIQYASWTTAEMITKFASSVYSLKALQFTKLLDAETSYSLRVTTSSMFAKTSSAMDKALLITTIVACVLCLLSAGVRTYGWMRRQQDLMMGMDAVVRFVLYYMNHLSNVFFIIIVLTCAFVYGFFRNQSTVDYMLPTSSSYIFGMLYAAVAFKGFYCLYKIHEQCNADIFVVDWERSKGQLLREPKEVPISMWRSTFLANELNELQTLRAWRPLFSMMLILFFLEGLQYMKLFSTSVPEIPSSPSLTASTNNFLRIAVAAFFWIVITVGLWVLEFNIYYRFLHVHPLQAFTDLCSVSNISVMILMEPQWGFYIHGESIHQHSDVSMEEFQANLKAEAMGHMPSRGLGGQDQCQAFEVFIGAYMRQYLYLCYADLEMEYRRALHGEAGPVVAGKHKKCFDFLVGGPGKTRTFTEETLVIKRRINEAFMQSVRGAESSLMNKFGLHSLLDFPPNILFLNGAFAGDNSGKDIYFLDSFDHWGRFLLYGLDMELVIFYILLFFAIDTSLHNSFAAMIIVYVVDILLVWYRAREGEANMGAKTLFDEKFFL